MKTSFITQAVVGLALVVVFASCSTSRSYPDSRRYPDRYPPRERVIIVREQPRIYGAYRKPYRRPPVYRAPGRSRVEYRKGNDRYYRKDNQRPPQRKVVVRRRSRS